MAGCLFTLLTSHNRRRQTVAALEAVSRQNPAGCGVGVILVDAGSTDGTSEAVEARFPAVTVHRTTRDVYWNQGMRLAMSYARQHDPDHYLWLNDDTVLDHDALQRLLDTWERVRSRTRRPAIVVGTTRDPTSDQPTYGGLRRTDGRRPLRFELVPPATEPLPVETMHGNCVLLPRDVVAEIGDLEPRYTHAMGDIDYGLRARAASIGVWITPGTIGTCARNPTTPRGARAQLQHLVSSKGIPPREWVVFARRWGGRLWPIHFAAPYLRPVAGPFRGRSGRARPRDAVGRRR
jgi:GT2 family glycosyltransferase